MLLCFSQEAKCTFVRKALLITLGCLAINTVERVLIKDTVALWKKKKKTTIKAWKHQKHVWNWSDSITIEINDIKSGISNAVDFFNTIHELFRSYGAGKGHTICFSVYLMPSSHWCGSFRLLPSISFFRWVTFLFL